VEFGEFIRVVFGSETQPAPRVVRRLQPGDALRLKVLEVREDQRALVDLGRFRAMAEVSFPVRAGDEMSVTVIDTRGPLRLQLNRPAEAGSAAATGQGPIGPLRSDLLSRLYAQLEGMLESAGRGGAGMRSDPAAILLEGLRRALEPLSPEAGPEHTASSVRAWCEDSGLFFEKHLEAAVGRESTPPSGAVASRALERPDIHRILAADLRARLGAVKQLLTQRPAAHPERRADPTAELAASVDDLLREISRQLEQAVARQRNPDPFQVIHFCLPMKDGRTRCQLKISYPKQRAQRPADGCRAALLLELDRLGPTRVDLFLLERSLSLAFFVETERARQALENRGSDLCAVMAPWFDHLRLSVAVSPKKITGFETEDLSPANRRRLDVLA
jgi:hypothetical protein